MMPYQPIHSVALGPTVCTLSTSLSLILHSCQTVPEWVCLELCPSCPLTTMSMRHRLDLRKVAKRETWVLMPEASTFAPSSTLSNKDMDPVPPHLRTWTTMNYILYWISDATNVSIKYLEDVPGTDPFQVAVWELASSMIAIGLSWQVSRYLDSPILSEFYWYPPGVRRSLR